MSGAAHQPVRTVRQRAEIFQLLLQEEAVLILLQRLRQIHDLIIIASKVQQFSPDRHQPALEIGDMLLAHILLHAEQAPLISHEHLQVAADKL